MLWLRRIRLLRAQRRWRQLFDAHAQSRQTLRTLEQLGEVEQSAAAQCLRRAEPGAEGYRRMLRRAAAHQRQATTLATQAETAAGELAQMTRGLRAARVGLDKAKRLLEQSSPT
jgi:hypothetical protein